MRVFSPTTDIRVLALAENVTQDGAFEIAWSGGKARAVLQQWWSDNVGSGEWRTIKVEVS